MLILSSDSHAIANLGGAFEEMSDYLYDLGIRHIYLPSDDGFLTQSLKK
jgi:hypothetical protein